LVAISHLWAKMLHGPAAYAVWGFYLLSGYLMTHVLQSKYGFGARGLGAYASNRFLRIYPTYAIALVLSIALILVAEPLGIDLTKLNPSYGIPPDREQWLFALTLLPVFGHATYPVPVAGALGVEIGAYILMPLLACSRWIVWPACIAAAALHLSMGIHPDSFAPRYSSFWPCMLPFTIGCLCRHHEALLARFRAPRLALLLWGAHCLYWYHNQAWPWYTGLYVATALSAWVTISLAPQRPSQLDNLLGEFSYPIYLFHTLTGGAMLAVFGYERGLPFFLVSFALAIALSWAVIVLVDRPLLRKKRVGPLQGAAQPQT
jgi:peptidoglycan/LPS O-acetylase OafA/YrhL